MAATESTRGRGRWLIEWDGGWTTADSFSEALDIQTVIARGGDAAWISVNEA
jgi:hypothetical protein